jgi:hypothetical protein
VLGNRLLRPLQLLKQEVDALLDALKRELDDVFRVNQRILLR